MSPCLFLHIYYKNNSILLKINRNILKWLFNLLIEWSCPRHMKASLYIIILEPRTCQLNVGTSKKYSCIHWPKCTHCQHPLSSLCQNFKSVKAGIGHLSVVAWADLGTWWYAHRKFIWSSPSKTFSALDQGRVPLVHLDSTLPFWPDVLLN